MAWLEANAGLWGFLALILAVILGLPAFVSLWISLRDGGKTLDELHAQLRGSMGRVGGPAMQSSAIGTRTVLPLRVRDASGASADAVALLADRVAHGISVVVVGSGGTGKSRLLQAAHAASYRSASPAQDPLIEVVALSSVSDRRRGRDLEAFAVRQIARRYRFARRTIAALIAEARIVVAYDALDEAPPDRRAAVWSQLVRLAENRPVVVTTRQPEDHPELAPLQLHDLEHGHLGEVVTIEPLLWSDVKAELTAQKLPGVEGLHSDARAVLCNPLSLQMLLFLRSRRRLEDDELAETLANPDRLLPRFVGLSRPPGTDRSLLFGALLIADHDHDSATSFRAFPLQLGGLALRYTPWAALLGIFALGMVTDRPISAAVIGLAALMCSPYRHGDPLQRIISFVSDRGSGLLGFVVELLAALLVTNLCRVVVTSIQAGDVELGTWTGLLDPYYLQVAIVFWAYRAESPMTLSGSTLTWGPVMRRYAWPHVVVWAIAFAALLALPEAYSPALFGLVAYSGQTVIFLLVSSMLAWTVVRTPPWKWPGLIEDLVRRGILSRAGREVKFTHARVEQQLLWGLVNDGRSPSTLWRVFGYHWSDRLMADPLIRAGLEPTSAGVDAIVRLGRSSAPAASAVSAAHCYLEWIAVEPSRVVPLIRLHLRFRPRSPLRALMADALDRVGDQRGIRLANRLLLRRKLSELTLHYCMRVLRRHESTAVLEALIHRLEQAHADSRQIVEYLAHSRRRMFSELAEGLPPEDAARIDLERWPPRLDAAEESLRNAPIGPVRYARLAQLHHLRGDAKRATRSVRRSIALLGPFDGYDAVLESMVTAAALGGDPIAVPWLERARATQLRFTDRMGLRRNLGIAADDPDAAFFAQPDGTTRPADAATESRTI